MWGNANTRHALAAAAFVALAACDTAPSEPAAGDDGTPGAAADTARIPLNDLGTRTYRGFPGGLYAGTNQLTGAHLNAGLARAARIRPLDANGQPSANGRIVLLSIGMSNTTQEFCGGSVTSCAPWSFVGQAAADPAVNRSTLVIVDGARGGQVAEDWDAATEANYDMIRDQRLAARGVTEQQVQVVWMKVARRQPNVALPDPNADAYQLAARMADIMRALKVRYPNLQQVFASSRIYAGYATTTLNPEPYAYESGFAVKFVIQAQINQMATGASTAGAYGDLSYDRAAPWLAWGAYLWGAGSTPRSDGLVWMPGDFANDGTHPAQSGQQKVGRLLLEFFKTSPATRCWFLAGGSC